MLKTSLLAGFALLLAMLMTVPDASAQLFTTQKVGPGMTMQQVVNIWGQPDGYVQKGDAELLTYTNRLISYWSPNRANYHVVLKNGRVAQYGFGEVQQYQSGIGTFVIIPMK